jgi:hypothetical protein
MRSPSVAVSLGSAVVLLASLTVACGASSSGAGGGGPGGGETSGSGGGSGSSSGAGTGTGDAGSGSGGGSEGGSTITDAGTGVTGHTLGYFMGLNGFIDDPTNLLSAIGNVREYHDWQWCEGNGDPSYPGYPDNLNSYSLFSGSWDFDTYYSALKAAGVWAAPVIQGGIPWLNDGATPPVPAGASVTAPASYVAHADQMFQYAARYGSTVVPTSDMNVLQTLEDFNEEDAWWVNADGSPVFSPAAYAAMASADYDGDQGRLGATFGVKQADPHMRMVMGGLSGKGSTSAWPASITSYLDGVRTWAQANRGGSFPADVLNVHHYSFGPNNAAISPEDDGVQAAMQQVVAYRDQYLPGMELWITEFGYDTDPSSPLHAPPIGPASAEIVQGQWLVRTYLALLAAKMDRAFMYILRDDCSTPPCSTQFSTAGLTTVKGQWTPKPSYYFLSTFQSRLASMVWQGQPATGNANVSVATFADSSGTGGAYVLWAPTSNGTTTPGYLLDIGGATTATQVTLADQQPTGVETALSPNGGKVSVDVGETPVIVLVDASP